MPLPLRVAALLSVVEGLALLGYAVGETLHLASERLTMGVTTAVFLAVFGAFVIACAWSVTHGRSWARSPLVLSQLIQLGVAWGFWGGTTTLVAAVLAVVAVVVLVGLLHPSSIAALDAE